VRAFAARFQIRVGSSDSPIDHRDRGTQNRRDGFVAPPESFVLKASQFDSGPDFGDDFVRLFHGRHSAAIG